MDASDGGSHSLFYYSIQGLLKSWTALQLAVTQSLAGPYSTEKAQWLVGVIENFFENNADLESYEVENFLEEIMSNEFNILVEDNSISEIAVNTCKLYELWKKGENTKMKEFIISLPCVNLADCIGSETNNDKTVLDSDIDELSLNSQLSHNGDNPVRDKPDADGWVRVSHRKKH